MDASAIYDRAFFEMHRPWKAEYDVIADTLARYVQFDSVLDLGCGNGFLIARFAEKGKHVLGVDASIHALEYAPERVAGRIRIMDLTRPGSIGRFDLVVCSEVAEHLEECYAGVLVETICSSAARAVYFTAATPGQGGHHHVNEQPHEYWIARFQRHGFALDSTTTSALRDDLASAIEAVWWFRNNSLVFRKR